MIPYSRPKLFDFIPYPRVNCLKTIIPFIEAHTYIAHIWRYPPPPPPWGRIFASKGLCTSRGGYPCARVTLASGLKIARIYEQMFTRRVTTRLNFASFTGVFRYA